MGTLCQAMDAPCSQPASLAVACRLLGHPIHPPGKQKGKVRTELELGSARRASHKLQGTDPKTPLDSAHFIAQVQISGALLANTCNTNKLRRFPRSCHGQKHSRFQFAPLLGSNPSETAVPQSILASCTTGLSKQGSPLHPGQAGFSISLNLVRFGAF